MKESPVKYLLAILVYPLTSLVIHPLLMLRSLVASIKLFDGNLGSYNMFTPLTALNTHFYKTRAWNLFRYGRRGKSPFLGLGDFDLARTFHYTLPSFYPFWFSTNLTILLGLLILVVSTGVWLPEVSPLVFWAGLGAFTFSGYFYMTWMHQNYNILGWAFFPILVFALIHQQYYLVGGILFVVSFFSFTGWVVGSALLVSVGLIYQDWLLFLTLVPAAIKMLTLNFYPLYTSDATGKILNNLAKAIGLSKSNAKYVRKKQLAITRLIPMVYMATLQMLLLIFIYYIHGAVYWYLAISILLFIANAFFFRFADDQGMYFLFLIVGLSGVYHYEDLMLLIPFWLGCNPLPLAMNVKSKNLLVMPVLKPVYIKPLIRDVERFLSPLHAGDKVLLAYGDPQGSYENVFDGYRNFIELPIYVAMQRGIRLLPGWWSVFELNYEGAPDFWCREPDEVLSKMQEWKTGFAIVYQEDSKTLDPKWENYGYEVLEEFDWNDFPVLKEDRRLIKYGFTKWWLLRKPAV